MGRGVCVAEGECLVDGLRVERVLDAGLKEGPLPAPLNHPDPKQALLQGDRGQRSSGVRGQMRGIGDTYLLFGDEYSGCEDGCHFLEEDFLEVGVGRFPGDECDVGCPEPPSRPVR